MRRVGVFAFAIAGVACPTLLFAQSEAQLLRVRIAEGVTVGRISAPTEFELRAGELVIETREALVSLETTSLASRLVLGDFANEEQARRVMEAFAEAHGEDSDIELERHPETGRFLVVLPSGADDEAEARRLRNDGFPGARVVELPDLTAGERALVIRPLGGSPIRIADDVALVAEPPAGGGFLEWEQRPYRGSLTILPRRGITVVNTVPLEDYLLGVVPSELPPDLFPELEALKAQALAARTYALRPREVYQARGYDLCATAACQVYGGVAAEHPLSTVAVQDTAGEAIYHEGRLIDALYTAACGGSTENSENVFSNPMPYLVARSCVRENAGYPLRSSAPANAPLDAALTRVAGPLPEGWAGEGLGRPASSAPALEVVASALRWLGLPVCDAAATETEGSEIALGDFAGRVESLRCRSAESGFAGFPDPVPDGSEFAGAEHPALGRLLAEGLLDPGERGMDPQRSVSRREVLGVAARLLRREGRLFRRAQVRRASTTGILLEPDDDKSDSGSEETNLLKLEPTPDPHLFTEVRPTRIPGRPDPEAVAVPTPTLSLRPGDFVRYRPLDEPAASESASDTPALRTDLLILEDLGAALDRFSRQSSWLVPKNNDDLSKAVARVRPIGTITALEPLETGVSGRIVRLRIVGTEGELVVRGLRIRRLLGLAENLFVAEPRRNENGKIREWWFTGRGWGHGLGLCQAGAYGMAAAGADYTDILAHYYPETTIGRDRAVR